MKFFHDLWPIVVIVGTIAGAAWTAAWSVRDFMAAQIAASESRLTAQIAATGTRLTAQIAASEDRLGEQIEEVDERLTLQIAELRQYFVDHLEDHANAR